MPCCKSQGAILAHVGLEQENQEKEYLCMLREVQRYEGGDTEIILGRELNVMLHLSLVVASTRLALTEVCCMTLRCLPHSHMHDCENRPKTHPPRFLLGRPD